MPEYRHANRVFNGSRGVAKLGYFDNYFAKNTRKTGPVGKHFGVFFS